MTPEEKSKMIMELMAARERDAERIRRDETRIDELLSKVDELLSLQKAAMAAEKERDDYKAMVSNLLSKITALEERLKVRNKNLYGGKSQKGGRKKSVKDGEDRARDKDDSMVLRNPSDLRLGRLAGKRWRKRVLKQNQRSPVFIVRDFLTVP